MAQVFPSPANAAGDFPALVAGKVHRLVMQKPSQHVFHNCGDHNAAVNNNTQPSCKRLFVLSCLVLSN
jgi:hypothetical protein